MVVSPIAYLHASVLASSTSSSSSTEDGGDAHKDILDLLEVALVRISCQHRAQGSHS